MRRGGPEAGGLTQEMRMIKNKDLVQVEILLAAGEPVISWLVTMVREIWRGAHRPIHTKFHPPPPSTHLHIYTSIQQLRLVNIL